MTPLERAARAVAAGLGDDFDHAFVTKSEWNAARGHKGGRDRDINEPFQSDYIAAARAVLEAVREPDEGMLDAGVDGLHTRHEPDGQIGRYEIEAAFTAMIDHIREGK